MGSRIRRLPLWFRFAFAFTVAAAVVVGLVVVVNHSQQSLTEAPAAPNKTQLKTEKDEDQIIVQQQQAPHTAKLASGSSGLKAAVAAVTGYMTTEVSHGWITGPLDGQTTCAARGGSTSRSLFRCSVTAGQADTKLDYPFDVVVAPAAATVTYCQVVTPPIPSMRVPLKSACV